MLSKHQRFGLEGELWAKSELEARGYDVQIISDWFDDYDLIINGCLPVEVKIAQKHQRQPRPGYYVSSFMFEVSRLPKIGDFLVVLIVKDEQGRFWPYLTPSWLFTGRSTAAITSHPLVYNGMWNKYLGFWPIVDRLIFARRHFNQQLVLFNQS